MKNYKVCHISIVHKKNDIRIFHKECKSLFKHGYDLTYISKGTHNETVNGVKLIGFNHKRIDNRIFRILFLGKKIIKKAISLKADIYHIHDPELQRYAKYIKKTSAKVIYDSHENSPMQIFEKEWIPKIFRGPIANLVDRIERKNSKYCDLIFAVADSTCNRFSKFHNNTIKLENFPILEEFKDIEINYDKKLEKKTICYTGAIWKERGLFNTCYSVKNIKNYNLEIAGRIDISNLDVFIKGLPDNVKFKGYLSREKTLELYEKSICGLCLFESYPNNMIDPPTKIFEYMAAGIPVICSNFKSMEDTVLKYNCGYSVNPHNLKDIEDIIKKLINDKSEIIRMGKNGRKAIENILNWEKHQEVLLKGYELIL